MGWLKIEIGVVLATTPSNFFGGFAVGLTLSVAPRSAFSSRRPVPHGRARSSDMLFARRIACRTARPLLRCYCSSAKSNDIVLAVMNVGKQHAPLDDPMMAEFSAATPAVNALARATPGFVWSYDEPHDGSMRLTVPELVADDLLMPQLSVWADVDSLRHFAFKSGHAMYYKRRKEWFQDIPPPYSVLWWRSAADLPSMAEAFERLRWLRDHGPSEHAFTFKSAKQYPRPAVLSSPVE